MLSIIVPSFNRKDEIPRLLDSLSEQTYSEFEVVIVDDCSKEPVAIEKEYPFSVQVIRNQINQGAAESRNIGAHHAKYDWLLFLDDDDRFLPSKCQQFVQAIQTQPEINFIYHPAKCVMVNEGFEYQTHPFKDPAELTLDNILLANKIGGMPMIGIKKSFFLQVGGLSTELRSLEDYDFLLKLLASGKLKAYYLDEPLTYCTFHTKRASVSTDTKYTESAIEYIKNKYVKTEAQAYNFKLNAQYMLAYPHIMNLSRSAAKYYFRIFKYNKNIKMLIISALILISPKLAINIKRFV